MFTIKKVDNGRAFTKGYIDDDIKRSYNLTCQLTALDPFYFHCRDLKEIGNFLAELDIESSIDNTYFVWLHDAIIALFMEEEITKQFIALLLSAEGYNMQDIAISKCYYILAEDFITEKDLRI